MFAQLQQCLDRDSCIVVWIGASQTNFAPGNIFMSDISGTIAERELVLTRFIDAPREKLYRAWTDPDLLAQWFAPQPWTTSKVEMDVRPGGTTLIVMRSPEGDEYPNRGVYLEVVENECIVTTDAYTMAWEPSEKPFMTLILTFEEEGRGTRYTARALHWTVADREEHEAMGFREGWGQCADQLESLVATL